MASKTTSASKKFPYLNEQIHKQIFYTKSQNQKKRVAKMREWKEERKKKTSKFIVEYWSVQFGICWKLKV